MIPDVSRLDYAQATGWVYPRMGRAGGYFMRCCDCSLVHRLDFYIDKDQLGRSVLKFKVTRDNRKTAACRRGK